ncbi:unnamed protein product [Pedinophyceae sp. YPF-701]|nr:unnamed protein product [Pedinophyceae sp. YPF-701]
MYGARHGQRGLPGRAVPRKVQRVMLLACAAVGLFGTFFILQGHVMETLASDRLQHNWRGTDIKRHTSVKDVLSHVHGFNMTQEDAERARDSDAPGADDASQASPSARHSLHQRSVLGAHIVEISDADIDPGPIAAAVISPTTGAISSAWVAQPADDGARSGAYVPHSAIWHGMYVQGRWQVGDAPIAETSDRSPLSYPIMCTYNPRAREGARGSSLLMYTAAVSADDDNGFAQRPDGAVVDAERRRLMSSGLRPSPFVMQFMQHPAHEEIASDGIGSVEWTLPVRVMLAGDAVKELDMDHSLHISSCEMLGESQWVAVASSSCQAVSRDCMHHEGAVLMLITRDRGETWTVRHIHAGGDAGGAAGNAILHRDQETGTSLEVLLSHQHAAAEAGQGNCISVSDHFPEPGRHGLRFHPSSLPCPGAPLSVAATANGRLLLTYVHAPEPEGAGAEGARLRKPRHFHRVRLHKGAGFDGSSMLLADVDPGNLGAAIRGMNAGGRRRRVLGDGLDSVGDDKAVDPQEDFAESAEDTGWVLAVAVAEDPAALHWSSDALVLEQWLPSERGWLSKELGLKKEPRVGRAVVLYDGLRSVHVMYMARKGHRSVVQHIVIFEEALQ